MTIQTIDGIKLLGDCAFGQFDLNYTTIPFFTGHLHSNMNIELTALLTQAGIPFRNVLPQVDFNNFQVTGTNKVIVSFGSLGDIDDRYAFGQGFGWSSSSTGARYMSMLFNDSGFTSTTNAYTTTNLLSGCSNSIHTTATSDSNGLSFFAQSATKPETSWAGFANSQGCGLFAYQHTLDTNEVSANFWYAGIMDNLTTQYNYYNANFVSESVLIGAQYKTLGTDTIGCGGRHYIASTSKIILQTSGADYAINCSSGGPPTSQWLTQDFKLFDNRPNANGYTGVMMGTATPLRIGTGIFTIGQPVKLPGDLANRGWLPVGKWTPTKYLFMPCYSSTI